VHWWFFFREVRFFVVVRWGVQVGTVLFVERLEWGSQGGCRLFPLLWEESGLGLVRLEFGGGAMLSPPFRVFSWWGRPFFRGGVEGKGLGFLGNGKPHLFLFALGLGNRLGCGLVFGPGSLCQTGLDGGPSFFHTDVFLVTTGWGAFRGSFGEVSPLSGLGCIRLGVVVGGGLWDLGGFNPRRKYWFPAAGESACWVCVGTIHGVYWGFGFF